MNAIEIHQLTKTYATGVQALKGIDLKVEAGDFFALLGANGAGKTTAIGIMTSLVNKTAGTVKIFGHDIDEDINAAKRCIGVVPQEFNFSIFEKVIDIVVWQAGYFGMNRKEALVRAEEVLKALELWEKRDTKSMALSGGMKRRLMIARALMHRPKLLILDEPTAGVDVELRHGMWEYLQKLNQEGTTILLTTHYLEEVEQLCKNMAMIKDGVIVKQGAVKGLLRAIDKETYIVEVTELPKDFSLPGYVWAQTDEHTLEVDVEAGHPLTSVIMALKEAGVSVQGVRPKSNRMEQLFLSLLK
jgi:ABC-2 type transport system ATP-binding protein